MPINQNHLFEELDGVKCSIVEKNASNERVEFLKNLLEYNGYTVVVAATPAPKTPPAKPAPKPAPVATADGAVLAVPTVPVVSEVPVEPPPPPPPSTFTVGVTDLMFNPTNAIFGRLLRTPDGHVVTLAYWQQKEEVAQDEVPYFEKKV